MKYMSNKHLRFLERTREIYSEEFLESVYARLSIAEDKQKDFREYAIYNAVNFLDACEVNPKRLPIFKQQKVLEKYRISLEKAQREFGKVKSSHEVNSVFHSTLRKIIKGSENTDIEKMFHPYMQVSGGKHDFWYRSEALFNEFLETLVMAANEARKNIREDFKADLKKEFILEWVVLMHKDWSYFTDITFGLGDWFKTGELGNDEKGMYRSACVDVLYDLFIVVGEKILRSDIENAIRKTQQNQ